MFSIVRDFNPEFSIKVKSSAILGQEDFVYGLMNGLEGSAHWSSAKFQ